MHDLTVFGTIEFGKAKVGKKVSPTYIGGNGIVASLAAAKQLSVTLIGVVGSDMDMKVLRDILDVNISIDNVEQYKGKTFQYTAIYDANTFDIKDHEIDFGVYGIYTPQVTTEAARNSEFVFFSGSNPQYSLEVLKQLNSPKLIGVSTMLYHLENNFPFAKELIKEASVLFTNTREFAYLQKNIPDLFSFAKKIRYVFVTDKGKGVSIITKDEKKYFPFNKTVTPIDPTNAGDVFAATIMALFVKEEKMPLEEIVTKAHEEAIKVIMNDPYYRRIYETN